MNGMAGNSNALFVEEAADGYHYDGSHRGMDREMEMATLGKGEMARGRISFEVPANAKGLTLLWETDALSQNVIKVGLE